MINWKDRKVKTSQEWWLWPKMNRRWVCLELLIENKN